MRYYALSFHVVLFSSGRTGRKGNFDRSEPAQQIRRLALRAQVDADERLAERASEKARHGRLVLC